MLGPQTQHKGAVYGDDDNTPLLTYVHTCILTYLLTYLLTYPGFGQLVQRGAAGRSEFTECIERAFGADSTQAVTAAEMITKLTTSCSTS